MEATDTALTNEKERELVTSLGTAYERLMTEIAKIIVGQREVLTHMFIALLCRGHCLLLGVPGLAKTLMTNSLAQVLELGFGRIQFTPDLMPSDITGTDVINEDPETGKRQHEFLPGPIFKNFILADEINRTPPKTQAALLQAMEERHVTVGRNTYKLPIPFTVMATQNPIESEGTYVLPEAQLDRFMFCVKVEYPAPDEEVDVVKSTTGQGVVTLEKVLGAGDIEILQEYVRGVAVADDVIRYAVRLVGMTRPDQAELRAESVAKYVTWGASPRASQYLILGGKARALIDGRYHVDFEDVRAMAAPVLRHRLVLNFRSRADNVDADQVVRDIVVSTPEE